MLLFGFQWRLIAFAMILTARPTEAAGRYGRAKRGAIQCNRLSKPIPVQGHVELECWFCIC